MSDEKEPWACPTCGRADLRARLIMTQDELHAAQASAKYYKSDRDDLRARLEALQ